MFDFRALTMRNGNNRVIRGGSWNNDANNCRVANRNNNNPNNDNNNNLGFRVCLTAQPLIWCGCAKNKWLTRSMSFPTAEMLLAKSAKNRSVSVG